MYKTLLVSKNEKKSTGHVSESTDHLQKMDGCLVHNSRWAKEVLNEANA